MFSYAKKRLLTSYDSISTKTHTMIIFLLGDIHSTDYDYYITHLGTKTDMGGGENGYPKAYKRTHG
jgi:hypothetical protein